MDLDDAVRARRMVRSFSSRPVARDVLDRLMSGALRAPTAGNTRGTAWVVLEGGETTRYWDAVTTPDWRARSRRWPGLSRAPVVAVALVSPSAYVRRYRDADKAGRLEGTPLESPRRGPASRASAPGAATPRVTASSRGNIRAQPAPPATPSSRGNTLGEGEDAWPVPYWWGDAAFGVMTLLLGATAEGLGACFLGTFRGEASLLEALGVPDGWRAFGSVVLGHPDGRDERSASLDRDGPARSARLHRGRWGADAAT